MAAKTWQTDFRFPAIQASIRALGDSYHDDPFRYPGSFCLPIAERPVVGWTPGKVSLLAIVVGFALLIAGVALGSLSDDQPGIAGNLLLVLAVCCTFAGIATFFLPVKFDRQVISCLVGERGRKQLEQAHRAPLMSAELGSADPSSMKISIDGDDHVLILFDQEKDRLIIEGIGARYQIRAADVLDLAPFEFMNYLGVTITYRIDDQTDLQVAIARVSLMLELIRQLPFLFFLRKKVPNRLLENSQRTLRPENSAFALNDA